MRSNKMATATFDWGEDRIRLSGEVIKKSAKTVLVRATTPEDFGGKVITIKRHVIKHKVVIE